MVSYKKTIMKVVLALALALVLVIVVALVRAGGGCNLALLSVTWNSPTVTQAEYASDYANRGGSNVDGTVTFTFSNGASPVTQSVNTNAQENGNFFITVPAYTTSINLDVTLSAQGEKNKNFRCLSQQ